MIKRKFVTLLIAAVLLFCFATAAEQQAATTNASEATTLGGGSIISTAKKIIYGSGKKKHGTKHGKKGHHFSYETYENPDCKKWGYKDHKFCVKRGPKVCASFEHKKKAVCGHFTSYCKKYKVKVRRQCKKYKKACAKYSFSHKTKCAKTTRVCSSIKYVDHKQKVLEKGGCKKYAYHKFPVCARYGSICWKRGLKQQPFCKNKVRKCVEKGIKVGKAQCSKFTAVFARGKKYCTSYAPQFKCTKYKRRKYCAKYELVSTKSVHANDKKNVILGNKYKDKVKKCVKWKYYYPRRKERKCVKYHTKRTCDVKVTSATQVRRSVPTPSNSGKQGAATVLNAPHTTPKPSPFLASDLTSKCLKYTEIQTNKCVKYKLVKAKICLKKIENNKKCVAFKRPVYRKQQCVAYKTPYTFYCKRFDTVCTDHGKTESNYCRKQKRVCKKWKFAKKRLFCLKHKYNKTFKVVKKPVCVYTNPCIRYQVTPKRKCVNWSKHCVKFSLKKRKYCAKSGKKCTKTEYVSTGKKHCTHYKPGACALYGTRKQKVCLEWPKKHDKKHEKKHRHHHHHKKPVPAEAPHPAPAATAAPAPAV